MPRLPGGLGAGRCAVSIAVALAVSGGGPVAHAQRGGLNAAQQAVVRKMQRQAVEYQQDVVRFNQAVAARDAEIYAKFDENGDGRVAGAEKSKYDKYLHEVRKGRQPSPYADIPPPGQGKATKK